MKTKTIQILLHVFLCFLCITYLFLHPRSYAQESGQISLTDSQERFSSAGHLYYLEDPDNNHNLSYVRSAYENGQFKYAGSEIPNFGFTKSAYWLHFSIQNLHPTQNHWVIEFEEHSTDTVEIYFIKQDNIDHIQMGDIHPLHQRQIPIRNPLYDFNLMPNESAEVFIKLQTFGKLSAPINIWPIHNYTKYNTAKQLIYGLFYGCIITLLLYNLLLLILNRDINYLNYCLLVTSSVFYIACYDGISYEYLWPKNVEMNSLAIFISGSLAIIFALQLTRIFLQLEFVSPLIDKCMLFAMGCVPVTLGISMVSNIFINIGINISIVLAIEILIFIAAVIAFKKGIEEAKYYSIAWGILILATLAFNLELLGIINNISFIQHLAHIGLISLIALLSFALAYRLDIIKLKNEATQKNITNNLEQEIKKRTEELDVARDKLATANQSLKENRFNDGLTEVRNRAYFEEHYNIEWLRCRREKMPIALLMLDIDNFRNLNENHGPLCGDHALVTLSKTLKKFIRRPHDIITRYNNKEFIIVLPNTDIDGAKFIAERLKRNSNTQAITFNNQKIDITVSIGCVSTNPKQNDANPQKLIDTAEKALNSAKKEVSNHIYAIT